MLTFNSARIFAPSEGYGLAVGNDADLNVIDAENVQEALRTRASRPYIVRKGKVVAYFERKSGIVTSTSDPPNHIAVRSDAAHYSFARAWSRSAMRSFSSDDSF